MISDIRLSTELWVVWVFFFPFCQISKCFVFIFNTNTGDSTEIAGWYNRSVKPLLCGSLFALFCKALVNCRHFLFCWKFSLFRKALVNCRHFLFCWKFSLFRKALLNCRHFLFCLKFLFAKRLLTRNFLFYGNSVWQSFNVAEANSVKIRLINVEFILSIFTERITCLV